MYSTRAEFAQGWPGWQSFRQLLWLLCYWRVMFLLCTTTNRKGAHARKQTTVPLCQMFSALLFAPSLVRRSPWCCKVFSSFGALASLQLSIASITSAVFNVICPSKHPGCFRANTAEWPDFKLLSNTKFPARLSVIAVACKPSASSSCRTTLKCELST